MVTPRDYTPIGYFGSLMLDIFDEANKMSFVDLQLTDQNFDEQVKGATTPLLVDFYADWCGPCKMMEPVLSELSSELSGKLLFGRLDVDQNQGTAAKFGVMSIPTLIIFKGGQAVKQVVGYQDKAALVKSINEVLQS